MIVRSFVRLGWPTGALVRWLLGGLETIREVWTRFDLPLYREPADCEREPEDPR